MGIRVRINGKEIEAINYSVTESATPLSAGDSRGSVGSMSFTVPKPDPDIQRDPGHALAKMIRFGLVGMIGSKVELVDSRRGIVSGEVLNVTENERMGTYDFQCATRLKSLNIYNVQAKPFVGTLRQAFEYYLKLAGAKTNIDIDPALGARSVAYPGWKGELWYHLKMMAAAQDADISLVSNVIIMRPIRARTARFNRAISASRSMSTDNLAQNIEVYKYNNRSMSGDMIYPVGDLSNENQIFSVNAGEVTEYAIELSASVSSVVQPQAQDWVGPYDMYSSAYSILTNDGLKVTANEWNLNGGSVRVIVNPDTISARLIIRAPRGLAIRNEDGEAREASSYALADYADGDGTARRATLRIIGTGVAFFKEKVTIPTGVSPTRTENMVGMTVDNPFISTSQDMYRAGTRAALTYSGVLPALNAELISVNRSGDSGVFDGMTYAATDAMFKSSWGNAITYDQVGVNLAAMGHTTYAKVDKYVASQTENDFENQVSGNTAGARVFDVKTRRWYRIREATITPESISVSAEDDMVYRDVQNKYNTLTYAGVQTIFNGMTYQEVLWTGLL